ncbi:MAG: aquaporin Z [Propionibacterium sp.]|nr:aquaporin Z [Propionibacterium sp.]
MRSSMSSRLGAEVLGTFILVFGGCGSAVLAASVAADAGFNLGIGFLGVALAFGLTVVAGAYAFGHISGGHFNPAVTLGAAIAGRLEWKAVPSYMIAQVAGGSVAAVVLWVIASGREGFSAVESGFATNGFGDLSPSGYGLLAVLVIEFVLTFVFLMVILGSTDVRAPKGFAPLTIGLTLTLIHLIAIPVSNTSVNPARSLAVAWFVPDALAQVWLFILAPLAGAAVAGLLYPRLFPNVEEVILEREPA